MKQIYICEDTITGIYSALHDAWKECRDTQAGVELRGRTQRQLFCEYRIVEESEEKALRLERMIKHHLGYNAYWEIYHALLSTDDRKGTVVFEVLQEARKIRQSEKIMEHLGCPAVADVFSMSRSVSNEAHRYEEFIRFRELENGILFFDIVNSFERIADHCSNLAVCIIEFSQGHYQTHSYLKGVKNSNNKTFMEQFETYLNKYAVR